MKWLLILVVLVGCSCSEQDSIGNDGFVCRLRYRRVFAKKIQVEGTTCIVALSPGSSGQPSLSCDWSRP